MENRKLKGWFPAAALATMGLALTFCGQMNVPEPPLEEEPLLLPEGGPLLLPEGEPADEGSSPYAGPVADNSRCYVCHINFEEDEFTITHARAEIGCEECHGASDAHCDDEDNITPPDEMFPKARINSYCMTCHEREKIDGLKQHKPLFEGTAPADKKTCTQCHGKTHVITYRTRRWNKSTGELIQDDKVRMIRHQIQGKKNGS